jgi:hypothetical protein
MATRSDTSLDAVALGLVLGAARMQLEEAISSIRNGRAINPGLIRELLAADDNNSGCNTACSCGGGGGGGGGSCGTTV